MRWSSRFFALGGVRTNRGRNWHDTRTVLNGVLWILGSGVQWSELPRKYPSYQTCHRRFQNWIREGKLVELLRLLPRQLHERGKGTKIVAIASGDGLPIAVSVESASPAECRLVEGVLAGCFLDELPARVIGDKAYDSDPLDKQLADEYGIEMIL